MKKTLVKSGAETPILSALPVLAAADAADAADVAVDAAAAADEELVEVLPQADNIDTIIPRPSTVAMILFIFLLL
jgi:hypothetical protein